MYSEQNSDAVQEEEHKLRHWCTPAMQVPVAICSVVISSLSFAFAVVLFFGAGYSGYDASGDVAVGFGFGAGFLVVAAGLFFRSNRLVACGVTFSLLVVMLGLVLQLM